MPAASGPAGRPVCRCPAPRIAAPSVRSVRGWNDPRNTPNRSPALRCSGRARSLFAPNGRLSFSVKFGQPPGCGLGTCIHRPGPHVARDPHRRAVHPALRRTAPHRRPPHGPREARPDLATTALVNEAWLRLAALHQHWTDGKSFIAAASETMRRILVDRARNRRSGTAATCNAPTPTTFSPAPPTAWPRHPHPAVPTRSGGALSPMCRRSKACSTWR